jgi:hypothetical protein
MKSSQKRYQTQEIKIYELIGIILGDGCLYYDEKRRIYMLEIVGNADEQWDFFQRISETISKLAGKRPKIRIKKEKLGKGIRLYLYNKKFLDYLINLGLSKSPKTFTAKIPKQFLSWSYSKYIIRGLFETDGSLFFSRSKNIKYPSYPRIEIKTSSEKLLIQLNNILTKQEFKVSIKRTKSDRTPAILISGEKMLDKWVKHIGFNTIKNLSKYHFFKDNGYYIPKMDIMSYQRG